jgi:Sperm-tail PG-rich repeat
VSKDFGAEAPKFSLYGKTGFGKKQSTPGPGQYNPKESLTQRNQKSPTLKGASRFNDNRRDSSPGPGMYYKEEFFAKNANAVTIKGKNNENPRDNSPGPGAYDPTLDAVKQAVRGINIASSIKPVNDIYSRTARDLIPGPGTYNKIDDFFGKDAPAFSLRGKSRDKSASDLPGPGAYTVNETLNKSIGFKMGTA